MANKNLEKEVTNINITNILNDINMQTKIISIILDPIQHDFREQVLDVLDLSFFESMHHRTLLQKILNYINKYNLVPPRDTLEQSIKLYTKDNVVKNHLLELVEIVVNYDLKDKDFVMEITLDFFRKQALKKSLMKAADEFESGNYGEIANVINEAMKKCEPKSKGHDYFKDIEVRMIQKVRKPVPCLHGLDSQIGGGLSGGELGIVLSPTGGGKSMMLVKFGSTALQYGRKVVYYSLELSETVIGNRFDACLNNIKMNEVYQFKDLIKDQIKNLESKGGMLKIKEYPTGTATVNTIKNHLSSLNRESGFLPDLIIIDYADIMKPLINYAEKRHSLTSIYEGLRALSMELNVPIWTASQTSRMSINKNEFDLSSISESLGKAQTADIIVGVARTDQDKIAKKAKLMVMKNRNGQDGHSMEMLFDTSKVDIQVLSTRATGMVNINGLDMEQQILGAEQV
jgi:replicative DNA helicase